MPIDEICAGLPAEYGTVLQKVRALSFEETPDYEGYIRLLSRAVGGNSERSLSRAFDWGPSFQR